MRFDLAVVVSFVLVGSPLSAQQGRGALLEVEVANRAFYVNDVADYSRLATDSGPVVIPQQFARTFSMVTAVGDIVRINGAAARGTWVSRYQVLNLSRTAQPSQSIADTDRLGAGEDVFEFMALDETIIGTIMTRGFHLGAPPAGAPSIATATNHAIIGGTGFFAGVRGQLSQVSQTFGRATSTIEDPGMRRTHPGGTATFVLNVFPDSFPAIVSDGNAPAVFHSDFSPVTSTRPARPAETLVLAVTGLGPTRPSLPPGSVFDENPLRPVHAPVTVVANGVELASVNQLGWPGFDNRYRVDFVVPPGAGSSLTIRLTVAGLRTNAVSVAYQP
ncbi:MAG: hypothetical protein FJW20_23655 [Acidimicrobiia bacterium]|nr:hypothetical protein [Acidimicrobiia bacterium]